MDTKTQKAIDLYNKKQFKKAFSIFKGFKLGFSKDEKRTLELASECLNGNKQFYISLGIDCDYVLLKAHEIVKLHYKL